MDDTCEKALEKAIQSKEHTEEWYAMRLALLRELAVNAGFLKEFCDIVANGSSGSKYPPTYAQRMNTLRHRAETAEKALVKAIAAAAVWQAESQRAAWPKDAQVEIDRQRTALAHIGTTLTSNQEDFMKQFEARRAAEAEVARLREVIKTGGAMYRLERACMGIPGGLDPEDGLK